MVIKCPHYYAKKEIVTEYDRILKPKSPPVIDADTENISCQLIMSIDKNLPSTFGREYRVRFCNGCFEDCAYKAMKDVLPQKLKDVF